MSTSLYALYLCRASQHVFFHNAIVALRYFPTSSMTTFNRNVIVNIFYPPSPSFLFAHSHLKSVITEALVGGEKRHCHSADCLYLGISSLEFVKVYFIKCYQTCCELKFQKDYKLYMHTTDVLFSGLQSVTSYLPPL